MKFRVLIEPDEDGVFVAECPVLPGCVSQGKSRAEAVANIRDAIAGHLHSLEKHNEPIPVLSPKKSSKSRYEPAARVFRRGPCQSIP